MSCASRVWSWASLQVEVLNDLQCKILNSKTAHAMRKERQTNILQTSYFATVCLIKQKGQKEREEGTQSLSSPDSSDSPSLPAQSASSRRSSTGRPPASTEGCAAVPPRSVQLARTTRKKNAKL